MKKNREYDVEVFYKNSKDPLFTWILSACGVTQAKSFAVDVLAGMTHREITGAELDEAIGFDLAYKMFRIEARLIRNALE